MARKRGRKPGLQTDEKIPEDEQWRIIEKSGVLRRMPPNDDRATTQTLVNVTPPTEGIASEDLNSSLCDELFNVLLLVIPFSTLYIMMDILAHRQYSQPYTISVALERAIFGIPVLSTFVFYTMRYKAERRLQAFLFFLSIICGSRLIYVVNWSNWRIVMTQCPPLGTIWVYTVVQLDLLPAVIALVIVTAYAYFKDLKIIVEYFEF